MAGYKSRKTALRKRIREPVEPLYTVDEAAEQLRVSRRTIVRWIRKGEQTDGTDGLAPVYALGRNCVRIPASAINRMLQARIV